ncbi:MAG: discoidin domain-containing protein [Blastocatellia bacterium]|nr:discoidin domain-containing protein [Blastocatellia bacterium]
MAQRPRHESPPVRPVTVFGDLLDVSNTYDERPNTRAYSSRRNYAGLSVTLDVGSQQNIIGVDQFHGAWAAHYPGKYKVEVAESENGPWFETFEGAGRRGFSRAQFEAVRARFIRITATATGGGNNEWSIAELKALVDPTATPRRIPDRRERPDERRGRDDDRLPQRRPDSRIEGNFRDMERAIDRNPDTFATTGTANYAGTSLTLDLGGEYEVSQVIQLHGTRPNDYPGEYKVEASRRKDESQFREVWRGRGEPVRSVARFDQITTRYIRITATRNRGRAYSWSIAELRTDRDADPTDRDEDDKRLSRDIRRATSQGFSDINAATDNDLSTSATTGRANYSGNWVSLDLGGSYTVSKIVQIHAPRDGDFPARYKIEVSQGGTRWQTVYEGEGANERSRATFDAVRTRFIRITATRERGGRHWWTISKFRILE